MCLRQKQIMLWTSIIWNKSDKNKSEMSVNDNVYYQIWQTFYKPGWKFINKLS